MKTKVLLGVAAAAVTASIMVSAVPAAAEVDYTFLSAKTNFLVDAPDFVTTTTTFTSPEMTCLKGSCSSVTFTPTASYDAITLSNGSVYKFAPAAFTTPAFAEMIKGAQFSTLEVSAAPEPASWALMIAGVGLVGGMLRYGRRDETVVSAA